MSLFDVSGSLSFVNSIVSSSGLGATQIGEPKSPPAGNGLSFAVMLGPSRVAELTMSGTIEQHLVTLRVYRNMLAEPVKDAEMQVAVGAQKILLLLYKALSLDGEVRSLDVGGIYGQSVGIRPGYITIDSTIFRVMDVALPLIVDNDSVPFAQ